MRGPWVFRTFCWDGHQASQGCSCAALLLPQQRQVQQGLSPHPLDLRTLQHTGQVMLLALAVQIAHVQQRRLLPQQQQVLA